MPGPKRPTSLASLSLFQLKVKVAQLRLTLCDPIDCSLPGSSVHGILLARVLEWVAISFSGDLSDPGTEPESPALQADSLQSDLLRKPHLILYILLAWLTTVGMSLFIYLSMIAFQVFPL